MTYWATLWYAGSVVFSMGFEGQTFEECNYMGEVMMFDIASAYSDPSKLDALEKSVFPTDEFSFTCENTRLLTNDKYKQTKFYFNQ